MTREECEIGTSKAIMVMRNNIAELEKENAELKEVHESDKRSLALIAEKGAELEREISILLSCNNCPENKGGLLCQKEYEDKCLAQKIQYIKELQQENAELRTKTTALENANRAMVKELDDMTSGGVSVLENVVRSKEQLAKAKEIIKKFSEFANLEVEYDPEHPQEHTDLWNELCKEAEQFLKECE